MEKKRVQLAKDKDEESVSQGDVAKARHRWARTVNVVLEILDMIPTMDDETRNRIVQPLRTAEAKADRAREKANGKESEAAADEGEQTIPEASTEETPAAAAAE